MVQNLKIFPSVDYRLTEAPLDSTQIKSHKAISPDSFVDLPDTHTLYIFLERSYPSNTSNTNLALIRLKTVLSADIFFLLWQERISRKEK